MLAYLVEMSAAVRRGTYLASQGAGGRVAVVKTKSGTHVATISRADAIKAGIMKAIAGSSARRSR